MRYLTIQEFTTIHMYELPNSIYNAIEHEFANYCGEKIAKKILAKHIEDKLADMTAQSMVNIMKCFIIL